MNCFCGMLFWIKLCNSDNDNGTAQQLIGSLYLGYSLINGVCRWCHECGNMTFFVEVLAWNILDFLWWSIKTSVVAYIYITSNEHLAQCCISILMLYAPSQNSSLLNQRESDSFIRGGSQVKLYLDLYLKNIKRSEE